MFGMYKFEFKDAKEKIYQMLGSSYDNAYEKVYCQEGFEWHGKI